MLNKIPVNKIIVRKMADKERTQRKTIQMLSKILVSKMADKLTERKHMKTIDVEQDII